MNKKLFTFPIFPTFVLNTERFFFTSSIRNNFDVLNLCVRKLPQALGWAFIVAQWRTARNKFLELERLYTERYHGGYNKLIVQEIGSRAHSKREKERFELFNFSIRALLYRLSRRAMAPTSCIHVERRRRWDSFSQVYRRIIDQCPACIESTWWIFHSPYTFTTLILCECEHSSKFNRIHDAITRCKAPRWSF